MTTAQQFLLKTIPLLNENNTFTNLYDLQFITEFNSQELKKHYEKMYAALNMDESDFSDDDEPLSPILRCLDICYYPETISDYPELVNDLESILRRHRKWQDLESAINSLI